MVPYCSAPQNDSLIFSFVKDKVGVEKMTRNCRKMIEQTGDSLLLSKHSIQLSGLQMALSHLRKIKCSLGLFSENKVRQNFDLVHFIRPMTLQF